MTTSVDVTRTSQPLQEDRPPPIPRRRTALLLLTLALVATALVGAQRAAAPRVEAVALVATGAEAEPGTVLRTTVGAVLALEVRNAGRTAVDVRPPDPRSVAQRLTVLGELRLAPGRTGTLPLQALTDLCRDVSADPLQARPDVVVEQGVTVVVDGLGEPERTWVALPQRVEVEGVIAAARACRRASS